MKYRVYDTKNEVYLDFDSIINFSREHNCCRVSVSQLLSGKQQTVLGRFVLSDSVRAKTKGGNEKPIKVYNNVKRQYEEWSGATTLAKALCVTSQSVYLLLNGKTRCLRNKYSVSPITF